jgi:hypothetical protein
MILDWENAFTLVQLGTGYLFWRHEERRNTLFFRVRPLLWLISITRSQSISASQFPSTVIDGVSCSCPHSHVHQTITYDIRSLAPSR